MRKERERCKRLASKVWNEGNLLHGQDIWREKWSKRRKERRETAVSVSKFHAMSCVCVYTRRHTYYDGSIHTTHKHKGIYIHNNSIKYELITREMSVFPDSFPMFTVSRVGRRTKTVDKLRIPVDWSILCA